jgi:dihydrofolate reductase
LIFYIAISLDGYIARKDGSVDWLGSDEAADADYQQFYATIDRLLMGEGGPMTRSWGSANGLIPENRPMS